MDAFWENRTERENINEGCWAKFYLCLTQFKFNFFWIKQANGDGVGQPLSVSHYSFFHHLSMNFSCLRSIFIFADSKKAFQKLEKFHWIKNAYDNNANTASIAASVIHNKVWAIREVSQTPGSDPDRQGARLPKPPLHWSVNCRHNWSFSS